MLVKETFLGMPLERRAGSVNLPANLSVPLRRESSWRWDAFCYHTHTHTQTHTQPKLQQSQPDDISLTLRGREQRRRFRGRGEGRGGRLGKKGKQIREVDDISHILTGGH